ncbi:hypothetical protein ACRALDRAFT_2021095 [Sodiomyces alcalophilus JCM 7366]|uniref:uncharacterized protein n=1 Tax=Sodiomyces alcalophilus JCM 7366 TaxID=591952 RepID=UPI0039B4180F
MAVNGDGNERRKGLYREDITPLEANTQLVTSPIPFSISFFLFLSLSQPSSSDQFVFVNHATMTLPEQASPYSSTQTNLIPGGYETLVLGFLVQSLDSRFSQLSGPFHVALISKLCSGNRRPPLTNRPTVPWHPFLPNRPASGLASSDSFAERRPKDWYDLVRHATSAFPLTTVRCLVSRPPPPAASLPSADPFPSHRLRLFSSAFLYDVSSYACNAPPLSDHHGLITAESVSLARVAVHGNSNSPVRVPWSSRGFGADGPWPAVEVTLGRDQPVNLFPGRTFQSYVLSDEYCHRNASLSCHAATAGTYNPDQGRGSSGGIFWTPNPNHFMLGMDVQPVNDISTAQRMWLDTMTVNDRAAVSNASLVLVDGLMAAYPGGQWFPLSAGCLGLGGPSAVNQSFTGDNTYPVNASLVPGALWDRGDIPSNSFGMHIGSAGRPEVTGSLLFGGYDPNRVVGHVLVGDGSFHDSITLRDISIQVIRGASPFDDFASEQTGLLVRDTDHFAAATSGLPVRIDGCSPYLTLPKATCDAIAAHLPVRYHDALGLYLWDQDSPRYPLIVSSASVLTFSLFAASNADVVTIRIPFAHLNLTLAPPLADVPTPYFPCFTGGQGRHVLGRAFLQDAFLGANWNRERWFLAQAPGPNVQSSPRSEPIGDEDETVEPGDNDWETSWEGAWTVLTEEDVEGPRESGETMPMPGRESESPVHLPSPSGGHEEETLEGGSGSDLSTGALAAIATGAAVGALVVGVGGAALFFWRRRKRRKTGAPGGSGEPNWADRLGGKGSSTPATELHGDSLVRAAPGPPPQELP